MPNMNNTGPEGIGPTGRGLGSCPNKTNLFSSINGRWQGRGYGGRGGGRGGRGGRGGGGGGGQNCASFVGTGRFFNFSKKDEMLFLKEEVKAAEEQLTLMKNRLDEIDEQKIS